MNAPIPYVATAIVALVILTILAYVTFRNRRPEKLTPLAGLAFAFVLAGILFGENRLPGYILMGIGVLLAIFDIVRKSRGPVG